MRKLTLLLALLCATMMGWAFEENATFPNAGTYANQFYWTSIGGVTAPMGVNSVESKSGFDCIYVNVGQADFDPATGIVGCELAGYEGAGVWIKINSLVLADNEIYFKNSGGDILRGLVIHNNAAGAAPFDPASIDWSGVDFITGQTQFKIYFTEENRPSNYTTINIQTAPWADNNTGIYVSFPDGVSACSLVDKTGCWIEGAQVLMYLTSFVDEVTEVTITHASGTKTLYVYNANAGGGSSTPATSECFGAKGHFGNPSVKNVYYQFDYEGNNVIISLQSLTGYPLDFAEVHIMGVGNYSMTSNGAGGYSYTINNPTVNAEWYVRFLYSDTNMGGNEMTAENVSDTDPNIIYYVVSACTATTTENDNIALSSAGSTATASSGTAANGIDGNTGTRWEADASDPQWICVDFGARKKFNTVQLVHEGAYIKTYDIQISDDGTNFTTIKHVSETLAGPFPYEQTIELNFDYAAQYLRIYGTERGTGWGYSLWELRAMYSGASVLTSITLTAADTKALVGGAGVVLTATPKDQKGAAMAESVSYEITPAAAGHMSGNTYIPDQVGLASIRAYNGSIYSAAVQVLGVPSANLALSTNISTDNKIIAQSDYTPSGTDAFSAVDGNMGSVWQGSPTNGNVNDSREYDSWFVVDLGAYYNISLVALHFEGACSELYHIDFSANNSDWNLGYNLVGAEGINARNDYWTELNNNIKVRYVRFWSTKAATGWGMKMYEFEVYGTAWVSGDDEKPVMGTASLVSNTYEQAVIAVTATDNDEVARYHVVDASHGIDVNLTPAAGNITVTGLTHATDYNFTITAKDASGNESDNNVVLPVSIPFNSSINLALNKPCEAGYENTNPGESRDKANDGNDETNWNTYADRPASEEWWYVDLGNLYTLTNITAIWGDVYSTNYILQARVAAPSAADKADDAAWVTLATITDAAVNATKSTNVSGVGRYVRIHSLAKSANFFRLRELEVYGSGVASVDAEAPVMTSASLVSNTDAQAVIAVAATDNQGIANYHVVDAGNSFDGNFVAEAGQITVTGLTGGTNYTLVITAIDFFGNESANNKSVAVTTTAHYTEPQTAAPIPSWPAAQVKSLYSNTYPFAPASLTSYNATWWSWPVMTEGNVDGNTYLHYNLAADGMIGWEFAETSVASMEKLHIDIYSSGSGTLTIRPITTGGPIVRKTLTLVGQQWNSFDVELSEFPGHDWTKLFQFSIEYWNAGGLTGEHISVDNVYFYRETAIADNEDPTAFTANLAEESYLSVKINAQASDDSGAVTFTVKNGDDVVATQNAASAAATVINVTGLNAGTAYNFNVYVADEAGNTLEPIAVDATTKALPAAAPAPTHPAVAVKSIYSETYASAIPVGINFNEAWWQAPTIAQEVSLGGNNARYYSGLNTNGSFGITWNGDNKLDASGYQKVHFHIYPTNSATIEIYPVIQPEAEYHRTSAALVGGQWNEVIIDYTDKTFAPFNQFGIVYTNALGDFFIDNLYFFRDPDYTRTEFLSAGVLGTICLPNNVPAGNAIGATFYTLDGKDGNGKMVFEEVSALEAGKPYIFEAQGGQIDVYYGTTNVEYPVNSGALQGTFTGVTFEVGEADNIYFFRDHALWSAKETGVQIRPNRAWLDMSVSIPNHAPKPGKRYITMGVNGQNATTGMDQISNDQSQMTNKVIIDGHLYILRGEHLYNANGQLVK